MPFAYALIVSAFILFSTQGRQATAAGLNDDDLQVDFLNVGDGICVLVLCPMQDQARHVIIYDCGSANAKASKALDESEVVNYIGSRVNRLDQPPKTDIVVSHWDKDHLSYMGKVLNQVKNVGVILYPWSEKINAHNTTPVTTLVRQIDNTKKGHTENLGAWSSLAGGHASPVTCVPAKVEVLTMNSDIAEFKDNPKDPDSKSYSNSFDNDMSVILSVSYSGQRFLFLGDAGPYALGAALANAYQHRKSLEPLHATVLLAAHHGSNASLENGWFQSLFIQPKYVIFSAAGPNASGGFSWPNCTAVSAYAVGLENTTKHSLRCRKNTGVSDGQPGFQAYDNKDTDKAIWSLGQIGSMRFVVRPKGEKLEYCIFANGDIGKMRTDGCP